MIFKSFYALIFSESLPELKMAPDQRESQVPVLAAYLGRLREVAKEYSLREVPLPKALDFLREYSEQGRRLCRFVNAQVLDHDKKPGAGDVVLDLMHQMGRVEEVSEHYEAIREGLDPATEEITVFLPPTFPEVSPEAAAPVAGEVVEEGMIAEEMVNLEKLAEGLSAATRERVLARLQGKKEAGTRDFAYVLGVSQSYARTCVKEICRELDIDIPLLEGRQRRSLKFPLPEAFRIIHDAEA